MQFKLISIYQHFSDVWRILLERNDYVAAQKITKQMPDPRPYQIVIKKLANNFLAQQK